jgi:hypothetical protein
MVTSGLMQQYLGALDKTEPRTLRQICHDLGKCNSCARRTLMVMADLGIVKQVDLPEPACNAHRGPRKGWVKIGPQ